ncbi:hypothetical protein ACFL3C_03140 [Patescibacteria group bacterium]
MKEFFKKLGAKLPTYVKVAGIVLAAIILLAVVYRFVEPVVDQLARKVKPMISSQSYGMDYDMEDEAYFEKAISSSYYDGGFAEPGFAVGAPSIAPIPPRDDIISGDDAEEFEVTEYNATIETRHLEETCAEISQLKALDYVVFENASEYDQGCNYTFKVKHANADEILAKIEALEPKDFSENTYTIKKRIDNLTNEVEILENKKASIEATLEEAISAYDEITELATKTQDVESLTKIINSKLQIIERLTQEKININERLDRLTRSKSDQLDRLEYTYFYVNVFENKFVDGEELKDSWKNAVKKFVRDVNSLAQDITINLALLLLLAFQYGLYLLILLVLAKYGWRFGKYIWKK